MSGLHDEQHNEYRRKAARKAKGDHKGSSLCGVIVLAGFLAVSALSSFGIWVTVR